MTRSGNAKPQIIRQKNTLIQKIGGEHLSGRGMDPNLLTRMEMAIEAFVSQRPLLISEMTAELEAALDECAASAPGPGRFDRVFAAAHEILGFGTSFGYPMVTRLGRTLTAYLETLDDDALPDPRLVSIHVEAIVAASKGEQGERAGAVADELEAIVFELVRAKAGP